jgi:hypothetical protein
VSIRTWAQMASLGFLIAFIPVSLFFWDLRWGVVAGAISALLGMFPASRGKFGLGHATDALYSQITGRVPDRSDEPTGAVLLIYLQRPWAIFGGVVLGLFCSIVLFAAMAVYAYIFDRNFLRDLVHGQIPFLLPFIFSMGTSFGLGLEAARLERNERQVQV